MKQIFVNLGKACKWFWKVFTVGCSLLTNLIILTLFILLLSFFIQPEIDVPDGAALVLAPAGELVEKKTVIDPLSRFINGFAGIPIPEETLLQDVLDVIDAAADDARIKVLVLDLDDLDRAGLNQFRTIGRSLEKFRETGKKVIALGDTFDQGHYYLASFADEIYLNPMGSVNLWGFGIFRLYMKELIDRLAINFHVFKVGSFKSALEPFTRSDMSPEARAQNKDWLGRIWDLFCSDIGRNRNFSPDFITGYINEMAIYLKRSGGDGARMAVDNNLVDGLMTGAQAEEYLISLVGRADDETTFRQVHFLDYLDTLTPSYSEESSDTNSGRIGIIVARGNIVYDGEIVPGQISSSGLSQLIRQARDDEKVRAVVIRVDSPGGSAFASEQIRQELLLLKKTGKPFVVSMGSLAASGAYWIAADADRIVASPFTLTGSIGIYGMIPTFENTIVKIGVASDGIGTTKMASAGDLTQPLPPELAESIQLGVEEGYRKFITIVAEGRGMDRKTVDDIAQGRVWDGAKAAELGLVDRLGGLQEAVENAAELAGLETYAPVYIRYPTGQAGDMFRKIDRWSTNTLGVIWRLVPGEKNFAYSVRDRLEALTLQGDPASMYAHSLLPLPLSLY